MKTVVFLFVLIAAVASCTAGGVNGSSSSAGSNNVVLINSWKGSSGEFIRAVAADGAGNLYAAAGYDGILCFAVSNNSNFNKSATNIVITNYPVNDVFIKTIDSRKYLYAILGTFTNRGGFVVIDITGGPSATVYTIGTNFMAGVSGNAGVLNETSGILYTADEFQGIQVYTNTPVTNSLLAGSVKSLSGRAGYDIELGGSAIYVAAREGGVYVASSTTLNILAQITMPISTATAVNVNGNNLAVADQSGWVWFFDVSKPENPKILGSYYTGGEPEDVIISGSDAFVSAGSKGMAWLDITTISSPVLKSMNSPSGKSLRLSVNTGTGGYIYAAYGLDGIRIFKKSQ